MAQGKVDPRGVQKIVARTGVTNPDEWELAIRMYRDHYWGASYAAKAEEILRAFIAENKIEQPRLTEGLVPDTKYAFWVQEESEISWKKVQKI
jgi:hypothetical protein